MKKLQQEDVQIICSHSNISERGIAEMLTGHIYNDAIAWRTFLRLMLMTLGVGFTVLGIIYFFAYNWAELYKFIKLGIIEGLVVIITSFALIPKFSTITRNIILSGATLTVGALFAVFGQIYQTGANAYDFFLGWSVFVTLWVVSSNFAPLWLFYIFLLNTTLVLYQEQVSGQWSLTALCTLLFLVYAITFIISIILSSQRKFQIPSWFKKAVALTSISYSTLGIISGIFASYEITFLLLIFIAIVAFTVGIWYGFREKSLFYLSVISCSVLAIVTALFIKITNDDALLFVSIFNIVAVSAIAKVLTGIKKKWEDEVEHGN